MPRKLTTEEFIEKAKEKHGNKYDYSKVEYISDHKKVIIRCIEHGEFKQTPGSHLNYNGCPTCGNILNAKKRSLTTEEFIKKAKEKHGNKYDYSKVKYINNHKKVIIRCIEHGEFKQTPGSHLNYNGCPTCGNILNAKKRSLTTEEFIKKAKEKHGNKYDYSKVKYINNHKKVIIRCIEHGEFKQTPGSHLSGCGCPTCYGSIKLTTEEFIEKSKKKHGNKYNYSKVKYVGAHTKVIIRCIEHGEFKQTPGSHLYGQGCPTCANILNAKKRSLTTEDFIEKAKKVHGDKYNYSKVEYISTHKKVSIICKKHGEFKQKPNNHLSGSGCPTCNYCPKCKLWRTNGKLCAYCRPQNKNKLYTKTKEYAVVKYLRKKLPDNNFIHNKSVGSHCTKDEKENSNGHLFPDVRFDCIFYHLIVEVDEHKHRGANYKCDEQRMYDIIAKLGAPCIFIRYNPDSKESNKDRLVEKIKKYLEIDIEDNKPWDNYGFKVEYMFYKN